MNKEDLLRKIRAKAKVDAKNRHDEKKVVKTFRLDPKALKRLKKIALEKKCSETEVLESLLLKE